jgi:hypothetical protein
MNINRIRLGLSLTGMVVAVLAIMLNDRRLVWAAIALLAASILLRVVARRRGPSEGKEGL